MKNGGTAPGSKGSKKKWDALKWFRTVMTYQLLVISYTKKIIKCIIYVVLHLRPQTAQKGLLTNQPIAVQRENAAFLAPFLRGQDFYSK